MRNAIEFDGLKIDASHPIFRHHPGQAPPWWTKVELQLDYRDTAWLDRFTEGRFHKSLTGYSFELEMDAITMMMSK